ncbi:MAG: hypothetical protein JNN05_07520 [Candidatus Omnitrophica bacterium]|nr:hypothetical protein [Candidatus Omnitrophota bacterium]
MRRPGSSSNIFINMLSVAFFWVAIYAGHVFLTGLEWGVLVFGALVVAVFPLILRDFFRYAKPAIGRFSGVTAKDRWPRVLTKLICLYSTFGLILFCYLTIPMYWVSAKAVHFYAPFFHWITQAGWEFLIVCAVYFWWADKSQENPYDEYWQVGRLLLGRWKECQRLVLIEYFKSWFIKAFFLPFMVGFLVSYVQGILTWQSSEPFFLSIFNHWLDIFYAVDVLFGVLGYFWAIKLLNTHIQSTEPTPFGWWSCLACYSPFYAVMGLGLLPSQSEMSWETWLRAYPLMSYGWAVMILLLTAVYALATVAFGYRMSNLTYRGLITGGPYRYTKHPAYICKVLSWWMVSMPFCSTWGMKGVFVQMLSMTVVSLVYYVRAKTEENHLSNYPEYVQYANWINDHGLFAGVGKLFPALQYSYEKTAKSHSVVWFKKIGKG